MMHANLVEDGHFRKLSCVFSSFFQYFERQNESLREIIDDRTKSWDQLETQNAELNDRYSQLQIDYKTMNNRNKRFWETIESLEKKCENYKYKIELLENEKMEQISEDRSEVKWSEESFVNTTKESETSSPSCSFDFEDRINELQETIKELRVQQGIDNIEKEELKAEIEDISTDNQLLQHQAASLQNEIEEWKRVCEKAYKYKQLAEKYNSEFDDKFPRYNLLAGSKMIKLKSSSHEVLNEKPLCGPSDLLATKQRFLSSSVSHLYQPPKSLSVLSEMDSQYQDLVKRYENLLNKYHKDSDTEQGNKRSEQVQRAIQTLSWDFTTVEFQSNLAKEDDNASECRASKCQHCEGKDLDEEMIIDYKQLFVEIFAKLRES